MLTQRRRDFHTVSPLFPSLVIPSPESHPPLQGDIARCTFLLWSIPVPSVLPPSRPALNFPCPVLFPTGAEKKRPLSFRVRPFDGGLPFGFVFGFAVLPRRAMVRSAAVSCRGHGKKSCAKAASSRRTPKKCRADDSLATARSIGVFGRENQM